MTAPHAPVPAPRPTLFTVIERVGVKNLRLEERLCDAAFQVARRSLNVSCHALRGKAAIRVAVELEEALRATFRPSKRIWHWTPRQHRLLAEQILAVSLDRSALEQLIRLRCEVSMYDVMQQASLQGFRHVVSSSYHSMRGLFWGLVVSLMSRGFNISSSEYSRLANLLIACDLVASALLEDRN